MLEKRKKRKGKKNIKTFLHGIQYFFFHHIEKRKRECYKQVDQCI